MFQDLFNIMIYTLAGCFGISIITIILFFIIGENKYNDGMAQL